LAKSALGEIHALHGKSPSIVAALAVAPNGPCRHHRIPRRDQVDKKAEDACCVFDCSEILPGILPKLNLHDTGRKDVLKFSAFLREVKKQSPRSVYNKFENVVTFLKAQGIRGLMGKNDWPRFVEEEPEVYEREELETLFAVCDEEERLWYEFFLMTGMRECGDSA